jgi:hypothetical protein
MAVVAIILTYWIYQLLIDFYWFQPVANADFIVPVDIDGTVHQVRLELSCDWLVGDLHGVVVCRCMF